MAENRVTNGVEIVGDVAVMISGTIARGADMPEVQDAVRIAVKLAAAVAKELEQKHGIKTQPEVHEVLKTNGSQLGITFRGEGEAVAPTVYPGQLMADGKTFGEAVQEAVRTVSYGLQHGVEMPNLTAEEARQHIRLVLVNTEQNEEMLSKTPHFDVAGGELAAVPRWYIDDNASFLVTDSICSMVGITGDEALAMGQKNVEAMDFKIQSMTDIMRELMPSDMYDMMPPMDGPEMIVVSSPSRIQGAAALLDEKTMEAVHERVGGDFVVLPSSIHEVICIPADDTMSPDELRAMVREVNGTQVAPDERLSDQVFRCDGHKLTVLGETMNVEQAVDTGMKMASEGAKMAM